MPVQILRAVVPPDRAAFAERPLGAVDGGAGFAEGFASCGEGGADGAAGLHEVVDEGLALLRRKMRVGAAPEAAADDDVAAVGGDGGRVGHR